MTHDNGTPRKTPLVSYLLVAAASGLMGYAGIYATQRQPDNAAPAAQTAAGEAKSSPPAAALNPLAAGDMLTFVFKKTPEPLPAFTFNDASGAAKTIADWKGKVVLLNLWATWCVPCRKEMPALERLQTELGGDGFEVIALSVDRGGLPTSKKFLDEIKIARLSLYTEAGSKSVGLLRAPGLPTTLLINRDGREIGRLAGPAEWDSADAKRLIKSVLK